MKFCSRYIKMTCHSDKININTKKNPKAFTLMEVVIAVTIIGVIVTSILTVMNQCISTAMDSRTHMQAFEIARNNMETLLAENKLTEKTEFGFSETNPDIQWETLIETFTEPVTSSMWLRAVCSATYTDQNGELQTVELKHWLSEVPPALQKKIKEQEKKEKELMEQYADKMGIDIDQLDSDEIKELKEKIEQGEDITPEESSEPEPYVGPPGPDNWPPDWGIGEIIQWYRDNGYFD
ncbi:MAG: prepilin-type N-terminal cleavage/methylation domain-containing protein [Sedimentisphaerales bacterium]|nr:prepilin-type N-terminal cleavage/methylation domain-containing protein [Sedimentisphaerales bacterium]